MLTRFLHIPTPPGSAQSGALFSSHRTGFSSRSGVSHGLLGSESTPCSLYPKRSCFRLASLALRLRTEPALRAAPVFRMGGGSFALPLLRTDPPSVRRCSAGLIGFAKRSGSRLASLTLRLRTDPPSVRRCFGRLIFRFRTDPPSVRRCSARLIRQAETLELQPLRGLHQAILWPFLQNARPPAASRPPVGGGSFAPPCTPLSHHPRTAGRSDSFAMSATTD